MIRLISRRLRWLLPAGIPAGIASLATTAAANASGQPKLGAQLGGIRGLLLTHQWLDFSTLLRT